MRVHPFLIKKELPMWGIEILVEEFKRMTVAGFMVL
jgi:hypothetical protein